MPVNHTKEFLKSVHNEALFSGLVFRTLIEVSSLNFKAKFLKMAKINSEFLNVSLVEPAPESATTLVSLLTSCPLKILQYCFQCLYMSASIFYPLCHCYGLILPWIFFFRLHKNILADLLSCFQSNCHSSHQKVCCLLSNSLQFDLMMLEL